MGDNGGFDVSEKGVQAITDLVTNLTTAAETVSDETTKIDNIITDNEAELGPHAKTLGDALDAIKEAIEDGNEGVTAISDALKDMAEGYQDIIDNDRYSNLGNQ